MVDTSDAARTVLASAAALPTRPGVYRFLDERGRALYVGRAADLRSRVRSYWGPLGDRRHLARMIPRIAGVEVLVCQSRHEAAWLERAVLEHRMPLWNRTPGGQELPVWLRITDQGVRVEHEIWAARGRGLFGPYLGYAQARSAAAALDHVFPYRWAAARSGAEREMARARGVEPGDGVRMHAAVVAVLSGDGDTAEAARGELVRRRERCIAVLDFERAAAIQRQLEGLDWILEPVRVLEGGSDLDIHGWADDLLLTIELRDGRIRDWRVRPCSEQDAAGRLAATPERWQAFATENATLAASLGAAMGRARDP